MHYGNLFQVSTTVCQMSVVMERPVLTDIWDTTAGVQLDILGLTVEQVSFFWSAYVSLKPANMQLHFCGAYFWAGNCHQDGTTESRLLIWWQTWSGGGERRLGRGYGGEWRMLREKIEDTRGVLRMILMQLLKLFIQPLKIPLKVKVRATFSYLVEYTQRGTFVIEKKQFRLVLNSLSETN